VKESLKQSAQQEQNYCCGIVLIVVG